ncbi:MAG: ACP S-malonyltransferase [Humidesulfovibrio sp.]|uniref:ACP S-malonyltransferase n=1 Tax=Humidesulfovibrio sp. TaxID=2910988 RepID=UPI0027F7B29C|nr:ACP S-malonyltransferase [Humidesulfovibrio sp.]MDQ7835392.1 ACP S-malonyltransferase [Humidesulfovibrio sp.]
MLPTAFLFPGQGSQELNMGRDVAEAQSSAMDLWKLAEKISGIKLREIYWGDEGATPAPEMSDTKALQPALTVVNVSLWLTAKPKTAAYPVIGAAGHSLGEFAALAAAGVLGVEDVIKAVCERGTLMAGAGKEGHGMAAVVKLPLDTVEQIVDKAAKQSGAFLRIANHNSPAQYVLSGEKPALDAASALVKEAKGRAVPLAVSGAFHSPLMSEPANAFAKVLDDLRWQPAQFPVCMNVTGQPESDPGILQTLLKAQMTSSVLWTTTMQSLYAAGARRFVELGPKNVLTKLAPQNLEGKDDIIAQSAGNMDSATDL